MNVNIEVDYVIQQVVEHARKAAKKELDLIKKDNSTNIKSLVLKTIKEEIKNIIKDDISFKDEISRFALTVIKEECFIEKNLKQVEESTKKAVSEAAKVATLARSKMIVDEVKKHFMGEVRKCVTEEINNLACRMVDEHSESMKKLSKEIKTPIKEFDDVLQRFRM